MLTYTLVRSVKVSINGCSFTDIYMEFRNVYTLNNRTPGISVACLLRVGVYLSVVFQNSVFLIGGNSATLVIHGGCCTSQCSGGGCIHTILKCVGYIV